MLGPQAGRCAPTLPVQRTLGGPGALRDEQEMVQEVGGPLLFRAVGVEVRGEVGLRRDQREECGVGWWQVRWAGSDRTLKLKAPIKC